MKDIEKFGKLCRFVLNYDFDNVKVFYRKVVTSLELNRYDLVYGDFKKVLKIDFGNFEVKNKF